MNSTASTSSSAAAALALLEDSDRELQTYALQTLVKLVDNAWHEIADSASRLETLYEDASFGDRKLAALVASRLYYHLGDLDDALTFALGAEELFDFSSGGQFEQTIIGASRSLPFANVQPRASTSTSSSGRIRMRRRRRTRD